MIKTRKEVHKSGVLEKVYLYILLVIFGGIVLQAPLSVGFGTLFPHYNLLIKSWAEVLMLAAAVIGFILLRQKRRLAMLKEPLLLGIGVYIALALLMTLVFGGPAEAIVAGLIIDLRYIVFFVLVYVAMRLYPDHKGIFIKVGIAGALAVTIFALLQVFVLPADILKYLGYNTNTIAPYLTVDQNQQFVRINSTLRGPNPLGVYAGIALTVLLAFWLRSRYRKTKIFILASIVIGCGAAVALWASYSRSALIGCIVAIIIVLATTLIKRVPKRTWIVVAIIVVALGGLVLVSTGSNSISNIILHQNPVGGSSAQSDQGHLDSVKDSVIRALGQPFGAGIGTTGSASLYNKSPVVIENQYLFVAHEVGWLGLAFFLLISIGILNRLWQRRADWLALGVFASGIILAIVGLFLPVLADDTVAIVWWGLAALCLGGRHGE